MYKVFVLGWMILALLWNLPNIIIGIFTNPLQAIMALALIWIMIRSIINWKD